jgi:protein TonB
MRAKIEGEVVIEAVVLSDGTVGGVKIAKSLDALYGLDEQAVRSVKQWVFKPGRKDGQPVAVRVQITCAFTMGSKKSK